ncbi:hypothetical protein, partial [Streptomyces rimosus]
MRATRREPVSPEALERRDGRPEVRPPVVVGRWGTAGRQLPSESPIAPVPAGPPLPEPLPC